MLRRALLQLANFVVNHGFATWEFLLIVLGIITYVPALTMWLPDAVFGSG